ncbi:hypothetical protein SAMN04488051_101691 [Alkalimonas amylolytica]|uniref:Uncharacterized protein n=2 Tax=Alkalimonas amylolytica TaxID=152573 RepID=A0A1H3YH42_ALKAM|nr:hypothetical protein SAMN04488051_101691 [Alkalimonas amylolytica]
MVTSLNYPIKELAKLFDFLDSDTPATQQWVHDYLVKQGLPVNTGIQLGYNVQVDTYNTVIHYFQDPAVVRIVANKMRNAWRVRKHRKQKGLVTLSISLDKDVSDQLSRMCKGEKKSEVITMLINDNYRLFLENKKEMQRQKEADKRARMLQCKNEKLKKLILNPSAEASKHDCQSNLENQLKDGISKLYDIIYSANEQNTVIDHQLLLLATKIYYEVFSK